MSDTGLKPLNDVNEDEEVERLTKEVLARKNKPRTSGYKPAATQVKKEEPAAAAPAKKEPQPAGKIPAWKQEQIDRERKAKEQAERDAEEKKRKLAEMKNAEEIEQNDPVKSVGALFGSSTREDETGMPLGSEENDEERAKREAARLQKMIGGGY